MWNVEPAIGILALQGGVTEHRHHLEALGIGVREVRYADELDGLRGLILPGGESTCLGRLLRLTGMGDAITQAHRTRGLQLWGTCAGAILLAREVVGESPHLGLLDIAIARNAFGSQLDSFRTEASVPAVAAAPIPLVFIRAPQIVRVGPEVKVLLRQSGYVAAVEDTHGILATVFHPELSDSLAFHRYFALRCGLDVGATAPASCPPFLALAAD
jgi:pyridoxal 5'-phosphate synthase pdxT subunit